jgi:hypothetical protein
VTDDELREALDGLSAYDLGCVDSGIHDEALRQRCIYELRHRRHAASENAEAEAAHRAWEAHTLRDMWLSDEAVAAGYGVEELLQFIDWLGERMEYPLR